MTLLARGWVLRLTSRYRENASFVHWNGVSNGEAAPGRFAVITAGILCSNDELDTAAGDQAGIHQAR